MKTKKKFPVKNIAIPKKQNPFEVHINRSKYEVLGRKLKSEHGLPGVSKHKAIQKRKTTLLQEYKWKDKANQFIDSRIGERNSAMTEDDRIMARFAAERKKMYNKKTMFNLSETEVLTHRGQTLSEIEKFEDTRSDDEDPDDTGALRGKFVSNAHFGGGVLSQGKQDRESIINQLILESNKRIAERKRNKEQTLEATEQLDEEWKSLGTIVTAKPKDEDEINAKKNDKYDIVMRQFKFEPQAQATQRLKTDDEIAKEDREKLEKLENERLKQLREIEAAKYGNHRSADDLDDGFSNLLKVYRENGPANESGSDSDGSDGNSDSETNDKGDENEMDQDAEEEGKVDDNESNDDDDDDDDGSADDNCSVKSADSDELNEGKNNSKEIKVKNEQSNMKTENTNSVLSSKKDKSANKIETIQNMETSNRDSSEKCDSETSEDEDAMEDLTDLMPSIKEKTKRKQQPSESEETSAPKEIDVTADMKQKKKLKLDLPYVLNVPDDFDSFKQLLSTYCPEEQDIIFERIIKSNHPNLKPENKRKMLNLAEFVIELLDKESVSWPTLLVLVKLWATLKEFNSQECLLALVDSSKSKVDLFETDESVNSPERDRAVRYLVWYSLLVAQPRGVEVLLPLSQPVLSLACRHLSTLHPHHWPHTPVGLLLCHMLLKDAEKSSTLYIEGISFLHKCIKESVKCEKCGEQRLGPVCKCEANETDDKFRNVSDKELVFNFDESFLDGLETADPRVLYFAVVMVSGFVKAYRKYPQCKILFKPIEITFKKLKVQNFAPSLRKAITNMQELLQVLQRAEIPTLMKMSKKPKALRQYEPSFHTVTTSKAQRGLPAERQEEQKLLHKYKHEMKGAMRELRRDRQFLANIKLREQVQSDEQRIKKVKEIFGSAANQQGELRRMKRKK